MTQAAKKMSFVNPKNDVAFKKIFGSEDKTDILIAFLNAVLDLRDDKAIQAVELLNPYQAPKLHNLKFTLLDIRAIDKRGITFIIEMQWPASKNGSLTISPKLIPPGLNEAMILPS